MKIFKYIIPAIVGVCSFSCESLTDINQDPNGSTTATPDATLVSGIGYYGLAVDAFYNEFDALMAQYVAGGPGVALIDDERYFFQNTDYNNEWSLIYNQTLTDLKFTIDNGNEAQSAAANIMSVHAWQLLVDHFGDVPYFDALKGKEGITSPEFDDAKEIYDNLVERLDESIAILSSTDSELGGEDIIFDGNLDNWIRFANSLKLKLLMRQSITNAAEVGPQVVALIANGSFLEDEEMIVKIPYSGADGLNYNPMFARREAGIGQFYCASETTVDAMANDPRLSILYDDAVNTGTIVGMKQGNVEDVVAPSKDDYSFPSDVMYAEDNDVILMSHWEVYFLRAEAALRFNTADNDKLMYDQAVAQHFAYIGASGSNTFLTDVAFYDVNASVQSRADLIGVQKWISMNGLQEFEGWIETRRFDTQDSHVFTDGIFVTPTRSTLGTGVFPTIRLYPQTEVSYNKNTPAGQETTDKVFWDN